MLKINLLRKYSRFNSVLENLTYTTILEFFILFSPLIVYPYLIRILGSNTYSIIIVAQVISSFPIMIIDFGFNRTFAREISINKSDLKKVSEIVSSVYFLRMIIWILCLFFYSIIIFNIPFFQKNSTLFLFYYGLTFNILLFPQYFFQGIEKMKYVTLINVMTNFTFIISVLIFIKVKEDYILIPIFKTICFLIGGFISFFLAFKKEKLKLVIPNKKYLLRIISSQLPIVSTDLVASVKDRINILFISYFLGSNDITIYDLGSKFRDLISKPSSIFGKVFLPIISRDKNIELFHKILRILFVFSIVGFFFFNLFLIEIVSFLNIEIQDYTPLRLLLLTPIFLSLSSFIGSNYIIALGFNKYILKSIIFTTLGYLIITLILFVIGSLKTIYGFVFIALFSYFIEFVYRYFVLTRIKSDYLKN